MNSFTMEYLLFTLHYYQTVNVLTLCTCIFPFLLTSFIHTKLKCTYLLFEDIFLGLFIIIQVQVYLKMQKHSDTFLALPRFKLKTYVMQSQCNAFKALGYLGLGYIIIMHETVLTHYNIILVLKERKVQHVHENRLIFIPVSKNAPKSANRIRTIA